MDIKTLAEQHPELLATIQAEAAAQATAQANTSAATAATTERERIAAVLAVGEGLPGHGAMLQTLAFDGKTTAPEAALAVLRAETTARAQAVKAHEADAPAPVAPSAAPGSPATAEQQTAQAKAYAAQHGTSFVAALKALGFAA